MEFSLEAKFLSRFLSFGLPAILLVSFHSAASLAGGGLSCLKGSSKRQEVSKQIKNPSKFEEFLRTQNQLLQNSFGTEKQKIQLTNEKPVFYSFLASEADSHARDSMDRILPLGSAGTFEEIGSLTNKDSSRTQIFNCRGIPGYCFNSFTQAVHGNGTKRTLLHNPIAHLTVQFKVIGPEQVLFRFGAYVTDYREELVEPRLYDHASLDASKKYVNAIDYGAVRENELVLRMSDFFDRSTFSRDSSMISRNFQDYEYTAIFPVTPADAAEQAERSTAIEEFKKRADAVIQVKNALAKQDVIHFSRTSGTSSGFRVNKESSNSSSAPVRCANLTEGEKLVKGSLEFASLPLDLSERMSEEEAKKNNWMETPIKVYFEDCSRI